MKVVQNAKTVRFLEDSSLSRTEFNANAKKAKRKKQQTFEKCNYKEMVVQKMTKGIYNMENPNEMNSYDMILLY